MLLESLYPELNGGVDDLAVVTLLLVQARCGDSDLV